MKKLFFFFLVLQSCYVYTDLYKIVPQETADAIPVGSSKVIVRNGNTSDENFTKCYKFLLSSDFRIENENRDMGHLSAIKNYDGTFARLNVVFDGNSVAITGEWRLGSASTNAASFILGATITSDWERAVWNKKADYPSVAFTKAVILAQEFGNELIYK